VNGRRGFNQIEKGALIWYTDGSKTKNKHWSWSVLPWNKEKFSFSFGQYATVFQAEIYAIKACAVENLDRNYKNKNIYIPSDSQAAIKALVNTRPPQNWSGIATNPLVNWPDITEFN
jgi:hypothetical protein